MQSTSLTTNDTNGSALISASTVKNTAVYDMSGEKLGSVDDLIIGKRDGKVAYALMSFGGFLGIGEQYHPLPWHLLDYDTDLDGYRVSLDADHLKRSPNYSRDELATSDWERATDSHYAGSASAGKRTANLI